MPKSNSNAGVEGGSINEPTRRRRNPTRKKVTPADIVPHAPVVCSENKQFAVVDHMESDETIKLAKDENGEHHYIPLSWVAFVDDKVHVDRPGAQAMREWSTVPPEQIH